MSLDKEQMDKITKEWFLPKVFEKMADECEENADRCWKAGNIKWYGWALLAEHYKAKRKGSGDE